MRINVVAIYTASFVCPSQKEKIEARASKERKGKGERKEER